MSSKNYKNVLLIGAAGNVGKPILDALLADSKFNVTALSRARSDATFPSNVKVIKIDYSDTSALTKALENQDVVISTISVEGVTANLGEVLVQAALDANVKWLVPCEFGIDLDDPAADIPVLDAKVVVSKLLKQNQSRLAYTLVSTGPFLDWGFDTGFLGFDVNNRTAVLYNEGKNRLSGASLSTIGKTVAALLRQPQLAQNKRVYIADATFTQQEALALFEKYTNSKWTVKNVTSAGVRKEAEENFAKNNIGPAFVGFILSYIYGGSNGTVFEDKALNKQLGLPQVSLDQIIKQVVEGKNAAQK